MVLTCHVRTSQTGHTRRGLLGAGLGVVALSGCGVFGDDPDQPKPPDPLQPLLDDALALAAAYDRAVQAQPGLSTRLTPLAADHREHAAALAKIIGVSASAGAAAPAPSGADAADDVVAGLRRAEQAGQRTAVAACKAAAADRAGLVGSIAACRATHAEALR